MAPSNKGSELEELVRAYFARQGFFALRGVSYRFEDEEATDIDVWLYGRQTASLRTRSIVDVKNKRSPKAFERILWTRGLQLALGCDRGIVATTDTNPKAVRFAHQQKVSLLTKSFLDRLKKNLNPQDRLSEDEFIKNIQIYENQKQDGDWVRKISDSKSALVSLSGYPAFNKAMSAFSFFCERAETRPQNREQALRGAYYVAGLCCIALDSALEKSVYEDVQTRYSAIMRGVTYGDAGDSKTQSSIDAVLKIIEGSMENGRTIARQAHTAIADLFGQVRADVIAEYFSREHYAASLFSVGKELEDRAHARHPRRIIDLTTEAKSVLGIFADYCERKRNPLFSSDFVQHSGPKIVKENNEKAAQPENQTKLI